MCVDGRSRFESVCAHAVQPGGRRGRTQLPSKPDSPFATAAFQPPPAVQPVLQPAVAPDGALASVARAAAGMRERRFKFSPLTGFKLNQHGEARTTTKGSF